MRLLGASAPNAEDGMIKGNDNNPAPAMLFFRKVRLVILFDFITKQKGRDPAIKAPAVILTIR